MKKSQRSAFYVPLFLVAVLAILVPSQDALADFVLELDSSGGTVMTIADNSASDSDGTVGQIVFNGSIDGFSVAVVTGISKPILGDATHAELNLNAVTTAATAGTLTMSLTDTDYSSGGSGDTSVTTLFGGTSAGVTSLQGYVDSTNVEFGTECTTGAQGPFGGAFDDTANGTCLVDGAFSMTLVAVAVLPDGGVQSFNGNITAELLEAPIACRFTGGGVDTDLNWDHTLEDGEMIRNGAGNLPEGIDRYQFGGQVGANTALPPQPSGEWEHHQQTGPSGAFSFHGGTSSAAEGTRIVDVRCSDPGFCFPARPAPAKQLDFDGIGTFSNVGKGSSAPVFEIGDPNVIPEPNGNRDTAFTYHWFEVNIDDLGEPGRLNSGAPNSAECPGRGFGEKSAGLFVPDPVNDPGTSVLLPYIELANCDCPDFYRITIYKGVLSTEVAYLPDGRIDPTSLNMSDVIYEAFGYIDGGNLQIHPLTGFDLH